MLVVVVCARLLHLICIYCISSEQFVEKGRFYARLMSSTAQKSVENNNNKTNTKRQQKKNNIVKIYFNILCRSLSVAAMFDLELRVYWNKKLSHHKYECFCLVYFLLIRHFL